MNHLCNAANQNEKFLLRNEAKLKAKVKRTFAKQLSWCIEAARSLSYASNSLEDDINKLLEGMPDQARMAEDIVTTQKITLDKGGRYIVKELDLGTFGIEWKLTNLGALKFLGNTLSHELSNYKGNITGVTKKKISEIMLDAVVSGQSYNVTAQRIMDQGEMGVFSAKRAEMIAVREARVAYEKGKEIPLDDFSNKFPEEKIQKYWQTVNDNRVTKPHRENQAAGWIDIAETFPGTGDKIAPGSDNPRCRCVTSYRLNN